MNVIRFDIPKHMWVSEKEISIAACTASNASAFGVLPIGTRTTGLVTSHWRPLLD